MHQAKALAHINWNRTKDFQHSYSNSNELHIWSFILKVGIVSHSTKLILGWRKKTSNITQLLQQQKLTSAL